ncbi:Putative ribonuclease H protein At1g65750 [Linum perenne]
MGLCSVIRAEMRGIVDGMGIAWDKGVRKLGIQSDSASEIKLLTDASWNNHQHLSLVRQFQEMLTWNWEVSIEHIYREANKAADFLANSGHDLDLGITVFLSPCNELLNWLRYDLVGVSLLRLVNNIM